MTLLSPNIVGEPMSAAQRTVIDTYVTAPDEAFEWHVVDVLGEKGFETVLIDMISQQWLTEAEVDRPLWQHRLIVTLPDQIDETAIAFLYIGGGSNNREPPTESRDLVREIALSTNTVVAELTMVPNQPLMFHDDGQPRTEDDLIAYAWVQYLETGDPTWLPRNAMVKSAVRAMDAITGLMREHRDGNHAVSQFVVGGGSKRGWATWLTGAMDDRVVAIVPIVIDVLNVDVSMRHHFEAYGFWAPSIGDYVNHGVMQRIGTPELKQLYDIVDPLRYVNRLKMPKFVVNASGDQFFLPDSSQFYWHELRDEKYLRYVPNTNHGLNNSDGAESVAAFHFAISHGVELPQLSWTYVNDHEIDVTFGTVPDGITLWQATNAEARDFRLETFGPGYSSVDIEARELETGARRRFTIDTPKRGWTAWFVELTYDIGFVKPLKLSTEVRVTPEKLPFAGKVPSLPTSLTFILYDVEFDPSLFDETNSHLAKTGLGSHLSVVQQNGKLFVNFVPEGNARLALYALAGFLRQRFGQDVEASLQLESGPGSTLAPRVR